MAIDDYRRGLLTGLSLNKNLASGLITSDYNELENTPIYVDDYGLIQINPTYQTFFDNLGGDASDYNNLTNIPLTLVTAEDGTVSVAVNSNYQDFFTSLSKDNDTIDYDAFINVPLFLDKDGSVAINENYQTFFDSLGNSSENTSFDYNNLNNLPLSLNTEGDVVVSENYQNFFNNLAKDTDTTNYDDFENIPLYLTTAEDGTQTVKINSNYQSFFDNLGKENSTDNDTIDYNDFINTPLSLSEDGSVIINEKYQSFFDNFEKKNNTENEEITIDPLTPMVQYRYNLDNYTADGTTINWLNQASGIATPFVLTGATLSDGGVNLMGTSTSRGTMAYAGSTTEYTIYLVANANGGMRVLETSGTGNYNTAICLWGHTGTWLCTACINGTEILSAVSSSTKAVIAVVKLTDGTYKLYINGELAGTRIDGKDLAAGNICLTYSPMWGSSNGDFYYYDFAFSESAHNEEDIISNSIYLMKKYSLIEENPPEESSMSYNDLIDKPLFINENNSITINEAYKEFFKNLIKEAVTELPIASVASLGGIKIGEGLTISEDGVLSTTSPSISSNNGVLVASMAEILEDKNLLIDNTILSDNSYMVIEGQITNNTIIGGIYSDG